jgi:hypothetical protein
MLIQFIIHFSWHRSLHLIYRQMLPILRFILELISDWILRHPGSDWILRNSRFLELSDVSFLGNSVRAVHRHSHSLLFQSLVFDPVLIVNFRHLIGNFVSGFGI